MYKVTYIEPGSKHETPLCESTELDAAKALARETLVSWTMLGYMQQDEKQGIIRDPEVWRPIAEDTIKIAWVTDGDIVYGEGYNGGSIIAPAQRFIRIEEV